MSYKDEIFTRCGSPRDVTTVNLYAYLKRAEKCNTFDDVADYDKRAARLIADCDRMIAMMNEYRQDLTARYNALATMTAKETVILQRYRKYDNSVVYYIRFFTEYEDGTEVETATETYTGTERHKAIKRFEELQKQRPGIEYIKDIEKKQWER